MSMPSDKQPLDEKTKALKTLFLSLSENYLIIKNCRNMILDRFSKIHPAFKAMEGQPIQIPEEFPQELRGFLEPYVQFVNMPSMQGLGDIEKVLSEGGSQEKIETAIATFCQELQAHLKKAQEYLGKAVREKPMLDLFLKQNPLYGEYFQKNPAESMTILLSQISVRYETHMIGMLKKAKKFNSVNSIAPSMAILRETLEKTSDFSESLNEAQKDVQEGVVRGMFGSNHPDFVEMFTKLRIFPIYLDPKLNAKQAGDEIVKAIRDGNSGDIVKILDRYGYKVNEDQAKALKYYSKIDASLRSLILDTAIVAETNRSREERYNEKTELDDGYVPPPKKLDPIKIKRKGVSKFRALFSSRTELVISSINDAYQKRDFASLARNLQNLGFDQPRAQQVVLRVKENLLRQEVSDTRKLFGEDQEIAELLIGNGVVLEGDVSSEAAQGIIAIIKNKFSTPSDLAAKLKGFRNANVAGRVLDAFRVLELPEPQALKGALPRLKEKLAEFNASIVTLTQTTVPADSVFSALLESVNRLYEIAGQQLKSPHATQIAGIQTEQRGTRVEQAISKLESVRSLGINIQTLTELGAAAKLLPETEGLRDVVMSEIGAVEDLLRGLKIDDKEFDNKVTQIKTKVTRIRELEKFGPQLAEHIATLEEMLKQEMPAAQKTSAGDLLAKWRNKLKKLQSDPQATISEKDVAEAKLAVEKLREVIDFSAYATPELEQLRGMIEKLPSKKEESDLMLDLQESASERRSEVARAFKKLKIDNARVDLTGFKEEVAAIKREMASIRVLAESASKAKELIKCYTDLLNSPSRALASGEWPALASEWRAKLAGLKGLQPTTTISENDIANAELAVKKLKSKGVLNADIAALRSLQSKIAGLSVEGLQSFINEKIKETERMLKALKINDAGVSLSDFGEDVSKIIERTRALESLGEQAAKLAEDIRLGKIPQAQEVAANELLEAWKNKLKRLMEDPQATISEEEVASAKSALDRLQEVGALNEDEESRTVLEQSDTLVPATKVAVFDEEPVSEKDEEPTLEPKTKEAVTDKEAASTAPAEDSVEESITEETTVTASAESVHVEEQPVELVSAVPHEEPPTPVDQDTRLGVIPDQETGLAEIGSAKQKEITQQMLAAVSKLLGVPVGATKKQYEKAYFSWGRLLNREFTPELSKMMQGMNEGIAFVRDNSALLEQQVPLTSQFIVPEVDLDTARSRVSTFREEAASLKKLQATLALTSGQEESRPTLIAGEKPTVHAEPVLEEVRTSEHEEPPTPSDVTERVEPVVVEEPVLPLHSDEVTAVAEGTKLVEEVASHEETPIVHVEEPVSPPAEPKVDEVAETEQELAAAKEREVARQKELAAAKERDVVRQKELAAAKERDAVRQKELAAAKETHQERMKEVVGQIPAVAQVYRDLAASGARLKVLARDMQTNQLEVIALKIKAFQDGLLTPEDAKFFLRANAKAIGKLTDSFETIVNEETVKLKKLYDDITNGTIPLTEQGKKEALSAVQKHLDRATTLTTKEIPAFVEATEGNLKKIANERISTRDAALEVLDTHYQDLSKKLDALKKFLKAREGFFGWLHSWGDRENMQKDARASQVEILKTLGGICDQQKALKEQAYTHEEYKQAVKIEQPELTDKTNTVVKEAEKEVGPKQRF